MSTFLYKLLHIRATPCKMSAPCTSTLPHDLSTSVWDVWLLYYIMHKAAFGALSPPPAPAFLSQLLFPSVSLSFDWLYCFDLTFFFSKHILLPLPTPPPLPPLSPPIPAFCSQTAGSRIQASLTLVDIRLGSIRSCLAMWVTAQRVSALGTITLTNTGALTHTSKHMPTQS